MIDRIIISVMLTYFVMHESDNEFGGITCRAHTPAHRHAPIIHCKFLTLHGIG